MVESKKALGTGGGLLSVPSLRAMKCIECLFWPEEWPRGLVEGTILFM